MRVALVGKMRSGKDTAADYIAEKRGAMKLAFADRLKHTFHELFPNISSGNKPRRHYQQYGELMRAIDENVWINALEREIQRYEGLYSPYKRNIVITDVRYPNELEWARSNNFVTIKINVDDSVKIRRVIEAGDDFDSFTLAHKTELNTEYLACDYTVTNNGTLEELYAQLDAVLDEIKKNAGERP